MHLRVQWINLNTKRAATIELCCMQMQHHRSRSPLALFFVVRARAFMPFCAPRFRGFDGGFGFKCGRYRPPPPLAVACTSHPMPYHGNSRIPTVRCACSRDTVVIQHAKWYISMVLCSSNYLISSLRCTVHNSIFLDYKST